VLLDNLQPNQSYTATVSAYDRTGNGPTTASTAFRTLGVPDSTAPLITAGPSVGLVDPSTVTLTWETNEPATTKVRGELTYDNSNLVVSHTATLQGLSPATQYNVTVSSTDAAGNGPATRELTFKTPAAADTAPPVITKGPWSTDVTSDAATINWETDEPANSGVSYNDGTAYVVTNDDALTEQHSVRLTSLSASTTYNVTVSSKDASDNGPTLSQPFQVLTLAAADTQGPVFTEAPTACNINQQLIQLCFRTDEPASVLVEYGAAQSALDKSDAKVQLVQQHSIPINGLTPSTTYYFRVHVTDQAGNERVSETFSIQTHAQTSSPPSFVTAPTVSYTDNDRVIIEWETDRPCNALVEYGPGNFDLRAEDGQYKTKQVIVLTNLTPGATYQFRVTATDVDGLSVTGGL
jgi:chitodextrinase